MKYNIIRNGSFQALTGDGTGNKSLTWEQLESLIDGNTTSSGVTLTGSDILYLEVDLSSRIKIDGIRLYASDLTKLSNINFYYKNSVEENYTACSKAVGTYYYATISDPSAPQYVRATVSGINIELYEFQIFNDDIIVGFGADGSLLAQYLENTAVGETSIPEAVAIFNNSTAVMSATGYVCIDWTGTNADDYIKISASENGTYYGIDDGSIIEDNREDSTYIWDMGVHSNTIVSSDNVVLIDPTISGGVYTSPIFGLDDKYMASYFITDGTTESGTTSISYDENVYNGTIRVRSSNTEPLCIDEIYWFNITTDNIAKYIVYNGSQTDDWVSVPAVTNFRALCVDRRTKDIIVNHTSGAAEFFRKFDRNGTLLLTGTPGGDKNEFNVNMEADKFGGVWGYGTIQKWLLHVNSNLTAVLYELDNSGIDFLYDLAVEMDGDGVWYTNQIDNMVIHKDYEGTTLTSIVLNEPRAICGTSDNGCWVIDNTDKKAYRYNSSGILIKTVVIDRTATRMCSDMQNGFWYIKGQYVYHVTSAGTENVSVKLNQPTRVRGGYNGCIVWSNDNDWVKYIDNNGNITRTFTVAGLTASTMPDLFSFSYADFVELQDTTHTIPASYDPLWGTGGSLEWKEVRKDGYFLPKTAYHQAEVTLRNNDGVSNLSLNKLIISPAVKVEDIQPQTSKNIYVKTVVPDGADITDYESRLKAWWGVNA